MKAIVTYKPKTRASKYDHLLVQEIITDVTNVEYYPDGSTLISAARRILWFNKDGPRILHLITLYP